MLAATLSDPVITWRDWRAFGDTPVRDVWRWFVPHVVDDGEIYIVVAWIWEIEFEGEHPIDWLAVRWAADHGRVGPGGRLRVSPPSRGNRTLVKEGSSCGDYTVRLPCAEDVDVRT